ncbi:MAG: hypothetical protein LBI94_05005 [Treponema sp.]|jgi:hypothetical protein|nr:hypothetical protein [Treponema sp.]
MRITKLTVILMAGLFLAPAPCFLQGEPVISGYLDSSVSLGAGAGSSPAFLYGIEEYANIRLQARLREGAAFYGSLNLLAVSGTYAEAARNAALRDAAVWGASSALTAGANYAAALELERLYVKISPETADFQAGLIRTAFGYGYVFGPMDFLNPRNPLLPDSRPRAVLGADLAYYPAADLKLQGFTAAAGNPFAGSGAGTLGGLAGEYHGEWLSLQGLYVFESPGPAPRGIHRFGLSVKAELGLAAELLYTCDPRTPEGGLAASAGFDYSLLDGKLYVLAEYLYSGDRSSTAASLGFRGNHYLFAQGRYRLSDYTSLGLGCMAAPEDPSFTPVITAEHELFQGLTLNLTCQIPLGSSGNGEFGPLPSGAAGPGRYFYSTVKVRLRF